jgi:1-acylglycerone phosphate reductase
MAEQKSGLIINFGSMAGDIPAPFSAIYNASKAALHAMTENLRLECQLLGIDVTLVIPGAVHSNVRRLEPSNP